MDTDAQPAPPAATTALRPAPAIEAAPPVTPNLVPRKEIPGARHVGRNTLETLLFRGLSTPVALLLVIIQSRFLHPSGRGSFVLAVLTVTIVSRLLGQLGAAVANRLGASEADVRARVARALARAGILGLVGMAATVGWSLVSGELPADLALVAALALVPNVVWQTVSGVLLGQARLRLWNAVQAATPLLTLVALLMLVVGLDTGVRGAVAARTGAQIATAAFALAAARDLWLPLAVPRVLDRHARAILRLALVMGAVQVVNLVSYRVELFILEGYAGVADVGIYSIAMQAAEAIWLVPAAIATAVTAPVIHDTTAQAARLHR